MTVREFFDKAEKNGFADYKFVWQGSWLREISGFFVSHVEKIVYVW